MTSARRSWSGASSAGYRSSGPDPIWSPAAMRLQSRPSRSRTKDSRCRQGLAFSDRVDGGSGMEILINELTSTVEVTSEESWLEPSVLRRVVLAVRNELRDQDESRRWEEREAAAAPRSRRSM